MFKLTQVRTRWVEPTADVPGHDERYTREVWLNANLVQYIMAIDKNALDTDTGPEAITEVGFGIDMAFQVTETVAEVVSLVKDHSHG